MTVPGMDMTGARITMTGRGGPTFCGSRAHLEVGQLVQTIRPLPGIGLHSQGTITRIEEGEPPRVTVHWRTVSWSNAADIVESRHLEILFAGGGK
jgi:hypothetical protein